MLATKDGQNRAFRKLDQLKPHIQWWEAGAQPPQFLASGDVVMSSAYNGRIAAVQNESNLQIVWNGGIYDFDSWAIPRVPRVRSRHASSSPSPSSRSSRRPMPRTSPMARRTPRPCRCWMKTPGADATAPENIADQVAMDVTFWADYGEQLEQRFNAWAAR